MEIPKSNSLRPTLDYFPRKTSCGRVQSALVLVTLPIRRLRIPEMTFVRTKMTIPKSNWLRLAFAHFPRKNVFIKVKVVLVKLRGIRRCHCWDTPTSPRSLWHGSSRRHLGDEKMAMQHDSDSPAQRRRCSTRVTLGPRLRGHAGHQWATYTYTMAIRGARRMRYASPHAPSTWS